VDDDGQVYDPALGRFVSADPVIDGALNTQGRNAYAYVKNNPLSFSDPTGFSRSWPTTRVLPIDPHSGVETITVEASRLYDNPIGPMFGFGGGGLQGSEGRSSEMEEIVVTGRRGRPPVPPRPTMSSPAPPNVSPNMNDVGREIGAAYGRYQSCMIDCRQRMAPIVYGATGLAGGAATGNTAFAGLGLVVGAVTGAAQNVAHATWGSGMLAVSAGHVADMFDHPTVRGDFGTTPAGALIGEIAGNQLRGPAGVFVGTATAGAIESLPGTAALLRAGQSRVAAASVLRGAALPAAAATIMYMPADGLAESYCDGECGGR